MRRDTRALGRGTFDLLVIGGGIYGAWAARDAALRGLATALVERRDWGSGTSGASSKLVHGGLRYLERGWIDLVRKTLSERELLARLGPHRIRRVRFVAPLYPGARIGRWRMKLGLSLYDALASGVPAAERHRRLDAAQILGHVPDLRRKGLCGGFEFGDAVTDDARLTLEIVAGAITAGAVAVNHVAAVELLDSRGGVAGALVEDRETGERHEVRARAVLAAAGPWLDAAPFARHGVAANARLTKGVHLVLPRLATDRAIFFSAPGDGRPVFLIPWYGRTLLGTTDTDHVGPADAVRVEDEDVDYLLQAAATMLNGEPPSADAVVGSFAGLRALSASPSGPPGAARRDWSAVEAARGLWLSLGGKLTSARADAAVVVGRIAERLGRGGGASPTATALLPWCPDGPFETWIDQAVQEGEAAGLDAETAATAALRHGGRVGLLHRIVAADPSLAARLTPACPLARGEVVHAVRHEMARDRDDVLRRRVPLALLAAGDADALGDAARLAAAELDAVRP